MSNKKVVILGGGVAGMSAAHELIERGFEVEVYEKNPVYPGGKARSVNVEGTENPNTGKSLPGEHGFRFFPGFYRHITDTMKRIPFQEAGSSITCCYDNLTPTHRIMLSRYDQPELITVANFPRTWAEAKLLWQFIKDFESCGLTKAEIGLFKDKVLQLMTSCHDRRKDEYERLGWWEYMEAEDQSTLYQHLLVGGMVRTLVAAQAKSASTKTGGNVFLQLLFNMATPGVNTDRVLNGPTNERWLAPWSDYLRSKGVKYYLGHETVNFNLQKNNIQQVNITDPSGKSIAVTADYYMLAVPVERAAVITADTIGLYDADDTLAYLSVLAESVSWMNGIQFYLNEDVRISAGHVIYSDSEWAVTSISQLQFWEKYNLTDRFNGKVKGILSVDVSDWLNTTFNNKLAKDCSREEIKENVWEQMKRSLNINGRVLLRDDMIEHYYIDSDIHDMDTAKAALAEGTMSQPDKYFNMEPLLVNSVHSWTLRPESRTNVNNLFLASDYVRTNTDLATMEGANEAARRAVNCIIDASGSDAPYCQIWDYSEPWALLPVKWYDRWRYRKGLPHALRTPWFIKALLVPFVIGYVIQFAFTALWSLLFFKPENK
jgi:uncharacterized protein with NAD-binding domain and iron-sulfur cluster